MMFVSHADVVHTEHRDKPTDGGGKCAMISRFIFEWESVANVTHKKLTEGRIRPYMQVVNRLIGKNKTIDVTFSVSLRLLNRDGTIANMTKSSASSTSEERFIIQTVPVTRESNDWLELNVTEAILSVWTEYDHQPPQIEFTLRMEVDCVEHKKVPIRLINPAEVELSTPVRRQKHTNLQPLLVVFLEDVLVKQKLLMEHLLNEEEAALVNDGADITQEGNDTGARRRRFANREACKVKNFTVTFSDLRLHNILSPRFANIGRCSGDCSHGTIKLDRYLATNHAKIVASAKALNDLDEFKTKNSSMYLETHKDPCCVPTDYKSLFLLLQYTGAYHQQLFPDFVVSKCGCR